MDRAAIGLGSVMLHLRAELNFHRLFAEAIAHFGTAAPASGSRRRSLQGGGAVTQAGGARDNARGPHKHFAAITDRSEEVRAAVPRTSRTSICSRRVRFEQRGERGPPGGLVAFCIVEVVGKLEGGAEMRAEEAKAVAVGVRRPARIAPASAA